MSTHEKNYIIIYIAAKHIVIFVLIYNTHDKYRATISALGALGHHVLLDLFIDPHEIYIKCLK